MRESSGTKFRILFVCEGNTCRSPMAEVALKAKVPKTLADSIVVSSGGIRTFSGLAPSVEAELAARKKGYDLSKHRARQIDETMMEQSDLILCMEPDQTRYLQERFPHIANRIFTFLAFCSGKEEPIVDPYRQDISVYFKTLDRIDTELNRCKSVIWDRVRKKISN